MDMGKKPHVTCNSGNDEWYTTMEIIESARKVLGTIDLDPASNETANARVRASKYYTKEQDGLKQEWYGNIWCNPPYSNVRPFADKLIESNFDQAIFLVNNCTDTKWFRALINHVSCMIFSTGRIKFVKGEDMKKHNSPTQGQCFFYFGNNTDKFVEEFKKYGWVAYPDSAVGKAS